MRALRVAGFAAVLTMALTSCGDDDDDGSAVTATADSAAATVAVSPVDTAVDTAADGAGQTGGDEGAYADAFSESLQQEGDDVVITTEQADCIGPKFVDTIGVERLESAGVSPAEVASGTDLDFSQLGLDDDDGNDLYDAFGSCDVDLRDTLVAAMAADDSMTEDVRQCLEDGFTDDVVRGFVVAAMVEGDAAGSPVSQIFTTCLGSAVGSLPVTSDD